MIRKRAFVVLAVLGSIGLGGFAYRDHCETRQAAARAELAALTPTIYAPQRVVYHLNEDGGFFDRRSSGRLGVLANHLAALGPGRLDGRVVLQGDGVLLLEHATRNSDLRDRLDDLRSRGIRFLVCRNSLVDRGIGPSDLYGVGPADIVPAAVAEISALEAAGFVYLRL